MAENQFVTTQICELNHKPVENLMEEVKNINKKMDRMKETLDKLPAELAKEFDGRYASKLSEKVLYSLVGIVLTAVIAAVMTLVLK